MSKLTITSFLMLGMFLLGNRCTPHSADEGHEPHLLDKIKKHQSPLTYEVEASQILDTSRFLKVHALLSGVNDFFTENRIPSIQSFPCSNCHTKPLEVMQAYNSAAIKKAHWNIQLAHANENTMNCTTCHAEGYMNQLATLTGELLDMAESFKLCGQCHSTQYNDWQGGAHGKQMNGWKPPRVAKTCVSCHNPHQPAFPSRFPARLNTNELGE